MKISKKIGVWMDHSVAHLIEANNADSGEMKTISSKFSHQEKEKSIGKSEALMHHKEQHEQAAYYHELEKTILDYDEVLLFGPTDAKLELFNILTANNHFEKIKIEVKQADKMTENQQHAFVHQHFFKHHIKK